MQLGEISFCDKIGYNIKQDAYKETILQELETNYGFKVVQRHHENFDPNSSVTQKRITNVPHLVSTKTNGNPYLLYLTKYNFSNQCIFIDKKIQHGYFLPRMICVKLWFNDRLFENTLFDGEMVKDNDNNWTYIINDIIAKENNVLTGLKLVQRMNIVYTTLKDSYFEDNTASCRLCVKKYFKFEEIPYMMEHFIPNLNYTCRGLLFKPIYSTFKSLLYNFNPSLIKSVVRMRYTDIAQKTFLSEADTFKTSMLKRKREKDKEDNEHLTSNGNRGSSILNPIHSTPPPPPSLSFPLASIQPPPCSVSTINDNLQTSSTKSILKEGEKLFCARKTKMPDVYEMQMYRNFDNGSDELWPNLETACVQDRRTSSMMRQLFNSLTFLEKKNLVCTYNTKFKKWQPLRQLN